VANLDKPIPEDIKEIISSQDESQRISEEVKKIINSLAAPNIAVIGRTGVGKSTLINAVFGIDTAPTGAGLPITDGFIRYPETGVDETCPLVIYDSAGYVASKEQRFVEVVGEFITESQRRGLKDQIHLVWYVINTASARVEPFEKEILNKVTELDVPCIIVLSQCNRASDHEIKGVEDALDNFQLKKVLDRIKVAATPFVLRGKEIAGTFGLEELVEQTLNKIPEIYSEALIRVQIVDLKSKRQLVWNYIATAASAAFAAGFIPLPGTTPLAAIASQSGLCVALASVYGYKEQMDFLLSLGTVASFNTLIATAFQDLISTFFPPSATLTGATAATYITIMGLVYARVFEQLAKNRIEGGEAEIKEFIKKTFEEEFKKYGLKQISKKISSPKVLDEYKKDFIEGN